MKNKALFLLDIAGRLYVSFISALIITFASEVVMSKFTPVNKQPFYYIWLFGSAVIVTVILFRSIKKKE
jgi:hypothetical protein